MNKIRFTEKKKFKKKYIQSYLIRNPKFTSDEVGTQGGELVDVDCLVPEIIMNAMVVW